MKITVGFVGIDRTEIYISQLVRPLLSWDNLKVLNCLIV